jgi:PAS domain S-box-containing protein
MFGYTPDDVTAGLNTVDMIATPHRSGGLDLLRDLRGSLAPSEGAESLGLRKDGSSFPIIVYVSPRTRGDVVSGLRGIIVDGTSRKRAEAEAKKLEAQLFQAQKLESIGTLAGGIAHDFNNLLTGILGGLSLLEFELGPSFPFRKELKEITDQVDRGAQLTKQLLGFARRGKYDEKPLDLNEVVDKTARMFGRTRKDIVLGLELTKSSSQVMADRTQLEQVLLNLFVNAGQAMPEGGTLLLRTEVALLSEAEVAAHGSEAGEYLRLSVIDTGVGMDARTRERVFEPFFTTKEPGRGTGLGLASVYGIVKNHGGFITVESELGQGATFSVYLPATHEKPSTRETQAPPARRGGETVLVVDDEEPILAITSRLLETMGYRVLTARGGREAVEVLRKHQGKVALVVLDMVMPEMSGRMTFEALRAVAPNLKVLLSSGYSVEGQATELLEQGCDGFIQKPFGLAALAAKLRELFQ